MECAGVVVVVVITVFTFVTMVVGVSVAISVAAPGLVGTGIVFEISSNKFGEACSHFTQKCTTRVDHEATAAGEFFFKIFVPVFSIRIRLAAEIKTFTFFGLGEMR